MDHDTNLARIAAAAKAAADEAAHLAALKLPDDLAEALTEWLDECRRADACAMTMPHAHQEAWAELETAARTAAEVLLYGASMANAARFA